MVYKKNFKIIYLLILFFLLSVVTAAQEAWENHTSFNDVRNITVVDDTLYLMTSGGMLRIANDGNTAKIYHNTDGLGTNNLTALLQDTAGQKWIAGFGRLIKFNGINSMQYLFFDNDENLFMLHTIADDSDLLWVGTDIGLVLFSKINDEGQIEDSYQLFGDLNPSPIIHDILLRNDSIWIATSAGLAVADRSNVTLLKSPSNWTTFSMSNHPVVENNEFLNIVAYQSALYTVNRRGVFKIELDTFGTATFTKLPLSSTATFNKIEINTDTLFVFYENYDNGYISTVDNDIPQLYSSISGQIPVTTGVMENRRWFGMRETGIFTYDNGTFTAVFQPGLPDNNVENITVTENGMIVGGFAAETYAASTGERGAGWVPFSFWVGQQTTESMLDSTGRVWMGTWGTGLWMYDGDTIINYDENNSALRGNSDDPPNGAAWVYISGLDTDGEYLYAASYRALNGYPVAIGDLSNLDDPSGWDSIGVADGLTNVFVTSLDADDNRVAVGTESDGIYECFLVGGPSTGIKTVRHLTRENRALISNTVRDVTYSPIGDLWVATNFGLSWYDPGIDFFRDIPLPVEMSSDITALEFDGRGNLWLGTPAGLAKRNANDGSFEIFTTLNSGLVADNVKNITFDKFTGEVYVATGGGISIIPSQQGKPVFNVTEVFAFPNPFVVDDVSGRLLFNYGAAAEVSIFTAAGERVKTFSVNSGWDGTNEAGKEVASGVYLFLLKDEEGNFGQGKILLVRN